MMRTQGYNNNNNNGSSSSSRGIRVDDDEEEAAVAVIVALDTRECLAWPDLLLSQILSFPASSLSKAFLDLDINHNTSNSCVQCVEALDCDKMSHYITKWEEEEIGDIDEIKDQANDFISQLVPIIPPQRDDGNFMFDELNSPPSGSSSPLLGNQTLMHFSPLFSQCKTTNGCSSWVTQSWSMTSNVDSKSQKYLDDIQHTKEAKLSSFMEDSTSTKRKAKNIVKGSSKTKLGEILQSFQCHNKDIKDMLTNPKRNFDSHMISSKRSRSSEIHNLSERRRRDRINEKMRALQELIPRSIKTDQASLLEEVIQYMKSLQNQVQIMSFRARMCIPSLGMHPRVEPLNMAQIASSTDMGLYLNMEMNMGDDNILGMRKSFGSILPNRTLLQTPLQDDRFGTPTIYPSYN